MAKPPITVYDSKQKDTLFKYVVKTIGEVWIYRFALKNFVVNSLRMRYRRSFLGFLWSLLNPLLMMIVVSVVFSAIFKVDLKVYGIYIFTGLAPWSYLNAAILGGCQTLINAEGFLKKVYLPKALFPLVSVTTETVNFLFSIISLYILSMALGNSIKITILLLPFVILITFIFNLGWAMFLGTITAYFRDLSQIMMVLFQALFYLTPIVYQVEAIPENFRWFIYYNPLYYFINLFRKVIYGTGSITLFDWGVPIGLALLMFLIGSWVMMRKDRDLVFRL